MNFVSPWIHTTEKCNIKCHYCYVKGNEVMTSDVYNKLGALLLNTNAKLIHLRFAGGEPLTVFDIWRPFAEQMLEHDNVSVEVLTNLQDPPSGLWKFAEHPKVNISVSLDNGKLVKKLDGTIDERLKRLREPWIMTTVTEENIDRLDVLAAFIGLNNYGWAITTDYFENNTLSWEKLSNVMLEVFNILKEFNYDFNKVSFNNFSTKVAFSGCCAGKEMFAVAPNGDIYRCQTEIRNGKKIGDVNVGYVHNKCTHNNSVCATCPINGFCTGWCPLHYKLPNPICNVIKIFGNKVLQEVLQNA